VKHHKIEEESLSFFDELCTVPPVSYISLLYLHMTIMYLCRMMYERSGYLVWYKSGTKRGKLGVARGNFLLEPIHIILLLRAKRGWGKVCEPFTKKL
jgi:hypothetical protein